MCINLMEFYVLPRKGQIYEAPVKFRFKGTQTTSFWAFAYTIVTQINTNH